jgi:hypothetical protein
MRATLEGSTISRSCETCLTFQRGALWFNKRLMAPAYLEEWRENGAKVLGRRKMLMTLTAADSVNSATARFVCSC